ncbi:MAG: 6-carboxytetrahydropterin synthase QueD [Lachnospiraceae bacterium]|nr:6-carboxytetrahydropterin synthase QueD [Lachnospiraceae bacterium]
MYTLKTNSSFDSAHFLSGYEGKCSNIHGHRWTVAIEVGNEKLDIEGNTRGMIVDFSKLKDDLKTITDYLDHCLIVEKDTLKVRTMEALLDENFRIVEMDFRPTAENFSQYFYKEMSKKGYNVVKATVYETPNNCATYYEG